MGLQEWPRFLLSASPPTLLGTVCFPLTLSQVIIPSFTHSLWPSPIYGLVCSPGLFRSNSDAVDGEGELGHPLSWDPGHQPLLWPSALRHRHTRSAFRSPAAAPLRTLPETVKTDPAPTSCSPQPRSRLLWSAQLHASGPQESPGKPLREYPERQDLKGKLSSTFTPSPVLPAQNPF